MLNFLRENWIWIAAPIVVFGLVLAWLIWQSGDGASPFIYNLW